MRRNVVLLAVLLAAVVAISFAAGAKKPNTERASGVSLAEDEAAVPNPDVSPNAPLVVPPPQALHPPFDWFSWETFIAINWPAATDPATGLPVRGQPDLNRKIDDAGWRVWETFKTDWETFGDGTAEPQPTAWNSWQVNGHMNPCASSSTVGRQKFLAMVSKMDSVIGGINQASNAGPLIDSNGNYVRYEILLNSTEYNTIVNPANKWYLTTNLPSQVNFPSSTSSPPSYGALEVKAAWRELINGKDDFSRFYSTNATIVDPGNPPTCRNAVMGLIGLHIAVKTAPFTEWVWATFEHEDNVPDGGIHAGVQYSLNNGTTLPPTNMNGFNYPPNGATAQTKGPPRLALNQPLPKDPPVQVTRFTPIDSNIAVANQAFHSALSGTKWVHYNLVADQWPTDPSSFKPVGTYPADSGAPFPVNNVANTSAETYFQNTAPLGNSCMKCHYHAAFTDFSWTLNDEAFPRPSQATSAALVPGAAPTVQMVRRANAFKALRDGTRQQFAPAPPPKK